MMIDEQTTMPAPGAEAPPATAQELAEYPRTVDALTSFLEFARVPPNVGITAMLHLIASQIAFSDEARTEESVAQVAATVRAMVDGIRAHRGQTPEAGP